MNKKEVERLAERYFENTVKLFGESKYHSFTPYLVVEYSPQSEGIDDEWHGEYISEENEIVIYSRNITSKSDLAKTIVHEYAHYLQDPKWMTRYYDMGYSYNNHPYEKEAFRIEEENWYKICK
jgi:predicted metalloprotease with PDZ domain